MAQAPGRQSGADMGGRPTQLSQVPPAMLPADGGAAAFGHGYSVLRVRQLLSANASPTHLSFAWRRRRLAQVRPRMQQTHQRQTAAMPPAEARQLVAGIM